MNPEFERSLKDMARELARPEPRPARIISIKRVLMPADRIQADPNLSVAELLSFKRERRKITQRGLAHRAGISPSTICRIESGLTQPTLQVLGRLMVALELSPEDTFNLLKTASNGPKQQI